MSRATTATPHLDRFSYDDAIVRHFLRPLHTKAVIFAFAGSAFFTGAYYSTRGLLKARMFSDGPRCSCP